jgi:hypothetical protein
MTTVSNAEHAPPIGNGDQFSFKLSTLVFFFQKSAKHGGGLQQAIAAVSLRLSFVASSTRLRV